MQSPDKTASERQNAKGPIEKKIEIETCRDCKAHRSNTWHDETKYETNFKLVKAAIESIAPDVEVFRKMEGPINLGAFELKHGEQVIYSKKNTGLWPNPKAVAQRVKNYFDDLEAGKNVSNYGKQKETAYIPPKKPSDTRTNTASGFHPKLSATNASTNKGATPTKSTTKEDSAAGSPGEEFAHGDQEDRVKGHHEEEEESREQHRQKSATPENPAEVSGKEESHERTTPPNKAEEGHEESKQESDHHKSEAHTPKEQHEATTPSQENTNKEATQQHSEEHKQAADSKEHTEKKEEGEPSSPAKEQHEANKAPETPVETNAEKSTEQEKKGEAKPKGEKDSKDEEYAEDFNN